MAEPIKVGRVRSSVFDGSVLSRGNPMSSNFGIESKDRLWSVLEFSASAPWSYFRPTSLVRARDARIRVECDLHHMPRRERQ